MSADIRSALAELVACNRIVKSGDGRKVRAGRWAKAWADAESVIDITITEQNQQAAPREEPGACPHGSTSVICSRCDADLIAAHDRAAAPVQDDDYSPEALVHWLRNNYARYGEIEDKLAADALAAQAEHNANQARIIEMQRAEADEDDKLLRRAECAEAERDRLRGDYERGYKSGKEGAVPALTAERDCAVIRAAELEACIRAADAMRQDGFLPPPDTGLAAVKAYDAARAKVELPPEQEK